MAYAHGTNPLQTPLSSPKRDTAPAAEAMDSSVRGLVAQALGGSDVRVAKVAELRQAIASGTYNVPAQAVADRMVEGLLSGR